MPTLHSLDNLPGIKPADIESLSPAEQKKLLSVIQNAQRVQETEYKDAMEQALSHVPGLLRGTIRKIISG
jgi:hypothetical protein